MNIVIKEPRDAKLVELYRLQQARELIRQFREWLAILPPEQRPEDTMENFRKWADASKSMA